MCLRDQGDVSEEAGPCPAAPGPSQLTCWPQSHPVMLTAWPPPPTAHQLLTKDKQLSVAFQTQTWDLSFSLKINILKVVFFLTVPAQVVFIILGKLFLPRPICSLFVLWSWPINQLLGIYCMTLSRKQSLKKPEIPCNNTFFFFANGFKGAKLSKLTTQTYWTMLSPDENV